MAANEIQRESTEVRIRRALAELRPYFEADGGDIKLVEVTADGEARLELHGSCASCSMIEMTMRGGVEQAVKLAAPEVTRVVAVS
jgi:Fe-S cluster biogenesis protein NfuA